MTAKEIFAKPGVLLFLGVLIGGALVWISSALTTKNWNLFLASTPNTGGAGTGAGTGVGTGTGGAGTENSGGRFVRPGSGTGTTTGDLSSYIPTSLLNKISEILSQKLSVNRASVNNILNKFDRRKTQFPRTQLRTASNHKNVFTFPISVKNEIYSALATGLNVDIVAISNVLDPVEIYFCHGPFCDDHGSFSQGGAAGSPCVHCGLLDDCVSF